MNATQKTTMLLAVCLPSVCGADSAEKIFESTGVRGGLVVHVGCGNGQLTAALRAGDGYLVHGLDTDPSNVEAARKYIRSCGEYGPVTVDTFGGDRLPYTDNLVGLLVSEDLGRVPMSDVMRVLRPHGVAYIKSTGKWEQTVKPWPPEIDEWTHFLHGPDNNPVAHDEVVDVPRRLQWLGKPKFARAHEQVASLSACVTTAGRMFYIIDDAPRADVRFGSQWFLVARDAFSGVVWKRPIPAWVDQLRRFRSGPAETAFRLAAQKDRVYVTLGVDAPVSILDAATGQTLATCEGTNHARQILRVGDQLVVLVDTRPAVTKEEDSQIRRGLNPAPGRRAIVAADAYTGETLWRMEVDTFVHPTLAARDNRLFFQTKDRVICLTLNAGKTLWQTVAQQELSGHELGWESPTLVVDDRAVYYADFKKIMALSVQDGAPLWRSESRPGYNSPPDVFLVDGLVWTKRKSMIGLDPATGEVRKEIPTVAGYMHARCYRNKATDRFFLLGNLGVQFVSIESSDASPNHWIRGTCQYGILPANGLLYVTPDSCACNMKTKLAGMWALASKNTADDTDAVRQDSKLEKGPAYGQSVPDPTSRDSGDVASWPVHRHDFARSGMTTATVPAALTAAWRADIGGRLSGVTVAGKRVYVASVDTHTVHALDEATGASLWSFTAGGRIDSPPTIYRGLTLFGSADGWVYALRASDGELAWRFRAAPTDRLTFVNGQLESVWPVHGSLIVHNGELVVPAGRSSYLDGGIRLCRLEPNTGRLLSETVIYSPDPDTGKQPEAENRKDVRGVLSDIVVADGEDLYMRHVKLDLQTGNETNTGVHLFCPVGLLDDTWWHRGYWLIHDEYISHWSGWWRVGNLVPSGRILSYDEDSVFGYGRDKYPSGNTGQWRGGERYRLFACDRPSPGEEPQDVQSTRASKKSSRRGGRAKASTTAAPANRWETQVPFYVRALVVAGDTMLIAGPPELTTTIGSGEQALTLAKPEEAVAAWNGRKGGFLWLVSARSGQRLAEYTLDAPPVFDGMAATEGRLFLAMTDGSVLCYAK